MDNKQEPKIEATELNEQQMTQVNGGKRNCDTDGYTVKMTVMQCSECLCSSVWDGDYLHQVFDCPTCHKHTFTGKNLMML